jgi:hypothetical protein
MKKRILILAAGGIGYVLGTKAGRERYEQMRNTVNKVKDDPRVQEQVQHAADLAKEKAPVVKDKLVEAADKGSAKVRSVNGGGSSSDAASKLNPESTALQDNPGPKGDLP